MVVGAVGELNGNPLALSALEAVVNADAQNAPAWRLLSRSYAHLGRQSEADAAANVAAGLEVQAPSVRETTSLQITDLQNAVTGLDNKLSSVESRLFEVETTLRDASTWLMAIVAILGLQLFVSLVLLLRGPPKSRPARASQHTAREAAKGPLVFASYSHLDKERVEQVVREIESEGLDLWLDRENIGGGATWPEEIVRAIRGARGVILFCSNGAFQSDHVLREVSLAAAYGKTLLPVQLEPANAPDGFLYYLSTRQIIDLAGDPAWRTKLVAAIKAAA